MVVVGEESLQESRKLGNTIITPLSLFWIDEENEAQRS